MERSFGSKDGATEGARITATDRRNEAPQAPRLRRLFRAHDPVRTKAGTGVRAWPCPCCTLTGNRHVEAGIEDSTMTAAKWLTLVVQASIVLTVVALGLGTRFKDATSLLRRPGALSRALLAMYVLMPALALFLALGLGLEPVVAVVLVAISFAPVPPLLPRKSIRAGGDPTYVVSLLATAAALSVVIVPLGLRIAKTITGTDDRVELSHVVKAVLVSVLLPLALGMTLRFLFPRFAARAGKPVRSAATVLLVASVPFLFVSAGPKVLALVGNGTLLAMALFVVVGLGAGHLFGGPDAHERTVLALACGARHPGVAVAIGTMGFAEPELIMAAVLLYLLVAAIIVLPYVTLEKRRHPPAREIDLRRSA